MRETAAVSGWLLPEAKGGGREMEKSLPPVFTSYLFAVLLTIVFAVLVNALMYFRLKKIDMIESLKSVE